MNVLVIEDDELLIEFMKRVLKAEGHHIVTASDGEEGFKKAQSSRLDAIILDILLPNKDGIAICRELRRLRVETPIIFLTSQIDERIKVEGLDAGADDYLIKPFSHRELIARLRAITRRPSTVVQSNLVVGDLALDPVGHKVTRGGTLLELSPKEYQLLEYMMRNPDVALPKHELLHKVWNIRSEAASNRLEVYVRHLRNKVDRAHSKKHILTVRGVGYKLRSQNF